MTVNKANHRVNVVRINELLPHNNADNLELVHIDGYQVVVKKGTYTPGQLAIYVQPDSIKKIINTNLRKMNNKGKFTEYIILYGIVCQGNPHKSLEVKLNKVLTSIGAPWDTPFDRIRQLIGWGELGKTLRKARISQRRRIAGVFRQIVEPSILDPEDITKDGLLAIKGIGMNTTRFIINSLR